jgi:hypothetical protein
MCEVRLELETEGVGWGDELQGRLLVRAGEQPVRLGSARVEIPGIAEAPVYESPFSRLQKRLSLRVEVPGGGEHAVPFSLRIPWHVYPQEKRDIYARLDTSAGELYAGGFVWIAPPARLVRIIRVLGELTGTTISGWEPTKDGDAITANLSPLDPETGLFDRLKLSVYRRGHGFYGRLTLDLPERTVGDRLRAAVGMDLRRVDVRFPTDDVEEVTAYLTALLRPYTDPTWSLPVPASAPGPAPETLPRPAGPAEPDGAALPRPAGVPEASP